MKTFLAVLGAIWLGCVAVLALMWISHVAGQQWERRAFHRQVNDDESLHEWLELDQ